MLLSEKTSHRDVLLSEKTSHRDVLLSEKTSHRDLDETEYLLTIFLISH